MSKKSYIYPIAFSALVIFLSFQKAGAQGLFLEDKAALDSVKVSVQHLYNFQFDRSVKALSRFKTRYAGHPGFLLLSCIRNYWKHFPIGGKTKEYQTYKSELNQVVRLSEAMMKKYPKGFLSIP